MDTVEVPVEKMEYLTSSKNSSLKSLKTSVNTPNLRTPGSVSSVRNKSEVTKPKSSVTRTPPGAITPVSVPRRNSTGGLSEKRAVAAQKRQDNGVSSAGKQKASSPSVSDPGKRSGVEGGRAPLPSISPKAPVPRLSARSLSGKSDSTPKPPVRSPATSTGSVSSSVKRVPSSLLDTSSNGRSSIRRAPALSSPHTPATSSRSFRSGSLSASVDRGSSLSGRRKSSTPDSREARFMMLPQVDIKAGDDVRLDLRGHRVRSLGATGLNLSPNLEFVYLRDNLLSSVEGIEILKRVKVLDLSFNDFKGPGFEPLGNCKALQQLYLAGNQITSLASLPQLPNLEFLSVAQNRLKSLSMASQPRLQVLAASKNKISTLKGFPHLPVLEHLRVEENPILEMPHLEAASILLVGPTLKKFNDRGFWPQIHVDTEYLKLEKKRRRQKSKRKQTSSKRMQSGELRSTDPNC